MDWVNERYVRVYLRDTPTWKLLSWEARALFLLMLRKADRSGVIETGKHGIRGLAATVDMPLNIVERCASELTESGTVEQSATGYVIPNFLEAQECRTSGAQRMREYRERRRVDARAGPQPASRKRVKPSGSSGAEQVTPRDTEKHNVTDGDATLQPVTPSRTVPSLAVPSQDQDQLLPRSRTEKAATARSAMANWPDEATMFWLEHVGHVTPGRCGKVLRPLVDRFGWPATRAGAELWIVATKDKGGRLRLEYFAAEASTYIDLARGPLVDDAGVLTAHGQLASGGTLS